MTSAKCQGLSVSKIQPASQGRIAAWPRCEARIGPDPARYRATKGDNRCLGKARYLVNGRMLCDRHAGWEVLNLLTSKT